MPRPAAHGSTGFGRIDFQAKAQAAFSTVAASRVEPVVRGLQAGPLLEVIPATAP